jgi:Putative MetA-pathway of phenol degradation
MIGNTTYSLSDRAHFLALIALVCVALFASAASTNATNCPTSADEISTDRPDFTSPPIAVPTGSVQLENGVTWSAENQSDVVEGPETLLRLGVAHYTEIFFSVPDYVYAIGGKAPGGFSDFVASAKLQLPRFIGFDSAAIAGMSFPTGGSQISSHGYDPDLKLPWRREINEHWALDGMFGIQWFTTEPHDNPSYESTFEIERDLGKSATIFAEYAANYPRHARPTDILDGAVLWRITPRQQLDIEGGLGINRPPDHLFGIGYSFRLDGLF